MLLALCVCEINCTFANKGFACIEFVSAKNPSIIYKNVCSKSRMFLVCAFFLEQH